jgi:hypothetical protein
LEETHSFGILVIDLTGSLLMSIGVAPEKSTMAAWRRAKTDSMSNARMVMIQHKRGCASCRAEDVQDITESQLRALAAAIK